MGIAFACRSPNDTHGYFRPLKNKKNKLVLPTQRQSGSVLNTLSYPLVSRLRCVWNVRRVRVIEGACRAFWKGFFRWKGSLAVKKLNTIELLNLTCPYADNWLPKRHKTLYARADRHAADVQRWRESCHDPTLKYYRQLFWSSVFIEDVPENHAIPIAWKLTERGGPFPARHPLDLIEHFKAVAVKDDLVMWVMLTDAIYSTIHWHLHGFWLAVDEDMRRRLPVRVARYRLELIGVLPKLPWTQVRDFSRAADYTRGKQ